MSESTRSQDAPRRPMDASQWTAVLEALDEVEARIPEADPDAATAYARLEDLRSVAVTARAYARLGTGAPSGGQP